MKKELGSVLGAESLRRLRLAQNALPRLEYLRATSQATGRTKVLIAALFIGPFIVGLELLAYFAGTATRLYSWETMLLLWPVPVVITGSYVLWHRRPRRRRRWSSMGPSARGLAAG